MLGGKATFFFFLTFLYVANFAQLSDNFIFTFQVSKLHLLIESVSASYDKFFFGEVGRETYDFFWADFADWYVAF